MAETNWLSTPAKTHAPTVGATVTIDPTISLTHIWTPGQTETVNASSPGMPQQILTLIFKTSGVTSYNITMGTNFAAATVIPTGTTSGTYVSALFMSTGSAWVLLSGSNVLGPSPTLGSGASIVAPSGTGSTGMMITKMVAYTEDATSVTHTGTIAIPATAWIHNIQVTSQALWTAGAAVMKVGDTASDNGYFTGIDLKANDLLVGEVLATASSTHWGGKEGAYLVAATGRCGPTSANFSRYYAAGSNITGIITVTTPATTAGRTFMEVTYSIGEVIAAVVA